VWEWVSVEVLGARVGVFQAEQERQTVGVQGPREGRGGARGQGRGGAGGRGEGGHEGGERGGRGQGRGGGRGGGRSGTL